MRGSEMGGVSIGKTKGGKIIGVKMIKHNSASHRRRRCTTTDHTLTTMHET